MVPPACRCSLSETPTENTVTSLWFDPFEGVVQCACAHGVGPRRNQQDCLPSFHTVEAVQRVYDRVVHIGLAKLGVGQGAERLLQLGFVASKVLLDDGLDVVG